MARPETVAAPPERPQDGGKAPPLGRTKLIDPSFLILVAITTIAALAVAWTKGPVRVLEIALDYTVFLIVLTPKILFGFFIAASVPILIPREVFTRWLGRESGMRGLLVASAAGGLVPGGPMMIFPLAVGFRAAGASTATLITFVTAWGLYGINRRSSGRCPFSISISSWPAF
ncbi:MAG: hypothetical protein AAGF74_04110 [Pseudomonadota bacterium]